MSQMTGPTRLSGLGTIRGESHLERVERERLEALETPGLLEGADLAAREQWIIPSVMRWASREAIASDPDFGGVFNLPDEQRDRLLEDIPTDLIEGFAAADSLGQAQIIREQLLKRAERRKRLAMMGWSGTALSIGAAFADPVSIAAGVATGGLMGSGAALATRASRLKRFGAVGFVEGSVEAGIETLLSVDDPTRGDADIAFAFVTGFVMAGGADALLSAGHRYLRRIQADEVDFAMGAAAQGEFDREGKLSRAGRRFIAAMSPADRAKLREDLIERTAGGDDAESLADAAFLRELSDDELFGRLLTPDDLATHAPPIERVVESEEPPAAGDGGAGDTGDTGGDEINPLDGDPDRPFRQEAVGDDAAMWGAVRWSDAGRLGSQKSGLVRRLANHLLNDALPKALRPDGTQPLRVQAAEDFARINTQRMLTRYERVAKSAWGEWVEKNQIPMRERVQAEREFFEAVGKSVRRGGDEMAPEPIKRVAAEQRRLQASLLRQLKLQGVEGFENVATDSHYLMRVWRLPAIDRAITQHGAEAVENTIATAMLRASPDLDDPDKARRLAKAALKVIRTQDRYTDMQRGRLFEETDYEVLREALKEVRPEMTSEQMDDLLFLMDPSRAKDKPGHSRARRRITLDESFVDEKTGLAIEDLIENDARTLFAAYARQTSGAMAITEVRRSMTKAIDPEALSPLSMDTILKKVHADIVESGESADKAAQIVNKLERKAKQIQGIRTETNGTLAQAGRLARGFNHLRVGGQFGMAQLPELANVVAETGFRAALSQMPAVMRVMRRAQDGQLPDQLINELEMFVAAGTDRLRDVIHNRFDMVGDIVEHQGRAAEQGLDGIVRRFNDVNLMAPINSFSQRWVAASMAEKFARIATGGRGFSDKRLADMGLSREMADRISAQIKQHSALEPGVSGRKLHRLNLDAWDDADALAHFSTAIDSSSRRIIQQVDLGTQHDWMTRDAGRVLFQFRSFHLAAYEKQLLHRLAMRDTVAVQGAIYTMMMGATVYTLQTYGQSIGRPDADEFRKERLSLNEIVKAGVQRSGWSSIAPGSFDTLNGIAGGDPCFTHRYSGLDANFLFGNPTIDSFRQATSAVRGVGRALRSEDHEFSEEEAQRIRRSLPFQNVTALRNALDWLVQQAPED